MASGVWTERSRFINIYLVLVAVRCHWFCMLILPFFSILLFFDFRFDQVLGSILLQSYFSSVVWVPMFIDHIISGLPDIEAYTD